MPKLRITLQWLGEPTAAEAYQTAQAAVEHWGWETGYESWLKECISDLRPIVAPSEYRGIEFDTECTLFDSVLVLDYSLLFNAIHFLRGQLFRQHHMNVSVLIDHRPLDEIVQMLLRGIDTTLVDMKHARKWFPDQRFQAIRLELKRTVCEAFNLNKRGEVS